MKFSKKDTAKIILVTGISVYLYIWIILNEKSIGKKTVISLLMVPSWFLSLLSNSGMSEVESIRNVKDVIKIHVFYIPVLFSIFLIESKII